MLPFLVSLTAARQSRVKCPLQANLILVVHCRLVFFRSSEIIMLQITNPLAKGSNKATLSCGWQVAAVFSSCREKRNTRSSSIGVWSMRLAGDESPLHAAPRARSCRGGSIISTRRG